MRTWLLAVLGLPSMYVPILRRVQSSQKRITDTLAAAGLRTVVPQLKKYVVREVPYLPSLSHAVV
jgi:hypothetical protein